MEKTLLSHKLRCHTGISGPGKSRNNTREKIWNFFFLRVLIQPISCWHVTRLWRHSVSLMNERQSLHDSREMLCNILYLSHKLRCYIGFSGLEKSRNNTREKNRYFFTCVDIANQLQTRHSPLAPLGQVDEWTAKPSRFPIQVVYRGFLELWRLEHYKIRIADRQ